MAINTEALLPSSPDMPQDPATLRRAADQMRTPRRGGRLVTQFWCCVLALATVVSATGLLYGVRGATSSLPGPWIADALPLDELPGLARIRLPVFIAVWGIGLVLLALYLRSRGVNRAGAAGSMTLMIGAWLWVATSLSLFSVRQVPMKVAIRSALHVHSGFIVLALAAVIGGSLGRPVRGSGRWRPILAWLTAGVGLINLWVAVVSANAASGATPGIGSAASAATVASGVCLVLVARGLARGKRRAWTLAILLLAASAVFQLVHGSRIPEALAVGALAAALLVLSSAFEEPGDPTSRVPALVWLTAFVGIIFGYGGVALWIDRSLADRPWSLGFAVEETTRGLAGLGLSRSMHLNGAFGEWFPLSVTFIATVGAVVVLQAWLRPWRERRVRHERESESARTLVRRWGADTLSPFTLRDDKSLFFSDDGGSFLAYTVRAGVALISGDPVGSPDGAIEIIRAFVSFARSRGWRVAVLGASETTLPLYRDAGLRALYWGDEGVVDTAAFSLEGRRIRKVRQSVNRLERAGFTSRVVRAGDLPADDLSALNEIARGWHAGCTLGGVMALNDFTTVSGNDAVFAIGLGPDGAPAGFLHLVVCERGSVLSLSTMPRRKEAVPNGFNEWLVAETVAWARQHGVRAVSLNFAPFAKLLDPRARLGLGQRVTRTALLALKSPLGLKLDNLLLFTGQFLPRWVPRYVVYEKRRDLPRVGLAGLASEGYLAKKPSTTL